MDVEHFGESCSVDHNDGVQDADSGDDYHGWGMSAELPSAVYILYSRQRKIGKIVSSLQ